MSKEQRHWTDRVLDILIKADRRAVFFDVDTNEMQNIGKVFDLVIEIQLRRLKSVITSKHG